MKLLGRTGVVLALGAGALVALALPAGAQEAAAIDSGNNAWILASAALVMFMTPGLAFFYGGLVRQKNVLSTIMYCFMALGVVTIVWVLIGHTLAFGPNIGKVIGEGGWIGGLDFIGFKDVGDAPYAPLTIPHTTFAMYQMMFAVITPALIAGTYAERFKFSSYLIFTAVWVIVVYAPMAHWVWGGGFLGAVGLGALDFAGGTVVHQNAGAAAIAAAIVLGKRKGYPEDRDQMIPHNVPFVVLGASILWFGWFGFNAGSALAADGFAGLAFSNTHIATAAAIFGWLIPEWMQHGKPTTVGAATGAVAGLVAITPAAGFVRPWSSIIIGFVAGLICYFIVSLKGKIGYDDSLDVVGVHYVGGLIGAILTGVFATKSVIAPDGGLIYSGSFDQVLKQLAASAFTTVWAFVLSFIILKVIDWTIGVRVAEAEEDDGLDRSQHGESGYAMVGS